MLTVVCIKWGTKYDAEYVTKLQSMAARHIPAHRFVCFTERPVDGVECLDLPSGLPSWWSKIGLFKPGTLPGDNLYLDLDVVLTGSLQPLIDAYTTAPDYLWSVDDFSYSLVNPRQHIDPDTRRLLGGAGTINSSVMMWRGDCARRVWDDFDPAVMDEMHGDQNWITRALWPDRIKLFSPGVVGSYKYGGCRPFPVTVFHGDPKPHQLGDRWIVDAWQ